MNSSIHSCPTAGISMIPMEQAAKLPVKTFPIPKVPGYHIVGIDVSHQLHCFVLSFAKY